MLPLVFVVCLTGQIGLPLPNANQVAAFGAMTDQQKKVIWFNFVNRSEANIIERDKYQRVGEMSGVDGAIVWLVVHEWAPLNAPDRPGLMSRKNLMMNGINGLKMVGKKPYVESGGKMLTTEGFARHCKMYESLSPKLLATGRPSLIIAKVGDVREAGGFHYLLANTKEAKPDWEEPIAIWLEKSNPEVAKSMAYGDIYCLYGWRADDDPEFDFVRFEVMHFHSNGSQLPGIRWEHRFHNQPGANDLVTCLMTIDVTNSGAKLLRTCNLNVAF